MHHESVSKHETTKNPSPNNLRQQSFKKNLPNFVDFLINFLYELLTKIFPDNSVNIELGIDSKPLE
jgi:hypothetical protein